MAASKTFRFFQYVAHGAYNEQKKGEFFVKHIVKFIVKSILGSTIDRMLGSGSECLSTIQSVSFPDFPLIFKWFVSLSNTASRYLGIDGYAIIFLRIFQKLLSCNIANLCMTLYDMQYYLQVSQ